MIADPSSLPRSTGARAALADGVARSVDRVRGISRSPQPVNATLYPGGRVEGVVLGERDVAVHIVIDGSLMGESLHAVGARVSAAATDALRAAGDGRSVKVMIDDMTGRPSLARLTDR